MAPTPPAHTPYPWQDGPSTNTPLDAANLQASEADLISYTQTVAQQLGSYTDAETARAQAAESALATATAVLTKRVTKPISSVGSTPLSFSQYPTTLNDVCTRMPDIIPDTPTRFRFKITNYSVGQGTTGGSPTMTGIYIGVPNYSGPSAGSGAGRWGGTFTQAPTQVLGAGAIIPGTAQDYISPWVTNQGQIIGGQMFGVSVGFTMSSGILNCDTFPNAGLFWGGTGSSAQAGNAAAPSNAAFTGAFRTMDIRLEYEFATPAVAPKKVVVALGDSVTQGYPGTDGGPWWHESWPGVASIASGHHFINMGIEGFQASNWAASFTTWQWQRIDLQSTVPDVAIISLGSNDIFAGGQTALQVETNLTILIAYLFSIGIGEVWLGTIITRGSPNAINLEVLRYTVNTWIRSLYFGVTRVIDFDKAIALREAIVDTTATLSTSSSTVTVNSVGAGIQVGAVVGSSGAGVVAANATVTAVSGTSITMSSAPTTAGLANLTFMNPISQSDPDLLANGSVNPHPQRSGYQAMGTLVAMGR